MISLSIHQNKQKKYKKILIRALHTNWFGADVSEPKPSEPNISRDFEEPPLLGNVGIDIASPGVCVEGVEGELGDGPVVFAVPELLAGPDDETGCFLFRPVWFFEALNNKEFLISNFKQNKLIIMQIKPMDYSIKMRYKFFLKKKK